MLQLSVTGLIALRTVEQSLIMVVNDANLEAAVIV